VSEPPVDDSPEDDSATRGSSPVEDSSASSPVVPVDAASPVVPSVVSPLVEDIVSTPDTVDGALVESVPPLIVADACVSVPSPEGSLGSNQAAWSTRTHANRRVAGDVVTHRQ